MFLFQLFDPRWWLLVGPFLALAIYAQIKVKSAFAQFSRMPNSRNLSGAEAAREMLEKEGVYDIGIERVSGWLSDHYDPSAKVLRLSPQVHDGRSVAAVGVACHEAGHALQHTHGYLFLGLRSMMVPTASIGSHLAIPLLILGFLFASPKLAIAGIIVFGLVVLFQIVNLPVEFNASTRAKDALMRNMVLTRPEEISGVRSVLGAAAMTYVATTLQSIGQLLYYVMLVSGGGRDD